MPNIIVFGGSFNPPGTHHRRIARELSKLFDEVIIVPCGFRPDKSKTNEVEPHHRLAMCRISFADLERVTVDTFDVEHNQYTPLCLLQKRYESRGEITHFIGSDLIQGGRDDNSPIQSYWKRGKWVWENCRFIVGKRPGYPVSQADLPKNSSVLDFSFGGSSTKIRQEISDGKLNPRHLSKAMIAYITDNHLYGLGSYEEGNQ